MLKGTSFDVPWLIVPYSVVSIKSAHIIYIFYRMIPDTICPGSFEYTLFVTYPDKGYIVFVSNDPISSSIVTTPSDARDEREDFPLAGIVVL